MIDLNSTAMTTRRMLLLAAGLWLAAAPASARQTATSLSSPVASIGSGASTQPAASASSTRAAGSTLAASSEYRLGADDLLNIEVWREPDVSGKVPVRPDGKISVPLVGEVQAAGRTALQLQKVISDRLKAYISSPEVTVVVEEVNSRKINVLGRVLHPGTYNLGTGMHVLDAVAMAGGPVMFAHLGNVYVLRREPQGKVHKFRFNYNDVIAGKKPGENILLQPGDTVVIP